MEKKAIEGKREEGGGEGKGEGAGRGRSPRLAAGSRATREMGRIRNPISLIIFLIYINYGK